MTEPCSVASESVGLGCLGTAPLATCWLLLEQDGPWGRVAATESHLAAELGAGLDAALAGVGGRFALIRRPGRHADEGETTRRVLLATGTDAPVLLGGSVADPAQLRLLDVEALASGDLPALLRSAPWARPQPAALLVCTNGRRDRCCATRGRPVALAGAAAYPGRVWETSHLGGHRFAPTAVLLPWGRVLGRLGNGDPAQLLDAADRGRLPVHLLGEWHDRGEAGRTQAAQAAMSALAMALGEVGLAGWRVEPATATGPRTGDLHRFTVTTPTSQAWAVEVRRGSGKSSPDSCGKAPGAQLPWTMSHLERVVTHTG